MNTDDAVKCIHCGSQSFATVHKGKICIIDPEKSEIGKVIGATLQGEYAVKVR